MEVLKRYCSLPDYQRMCCKSCSNVTIPEPLPNSSSRSTPVTSIHPTVGAPPPTITLSAGFTTIQPTKSLFTTISALTTNSWTITHSSTPVPVPHSTPTSLSTTDMIASHPSAATSAPVVPTTFSMATTSVTTTSPSIIAHPLPLPVPDTDESTDPKLQSTTNSPKTSGIITTTDLSAATSPTITIPVELSTKTDSPLKSKPKKNIPPKKKPKKVIPLKIYPKKNTALKNTTRKAVPPKNKPKKKTIPAPKKNTSVNRNPQNTTPASTTPKKTSPKKTTPEKSTPKKTTPKKTIQEKTTPKKTTQEKTTPKKTTPKKTTQEKITPDKTSPKKSTPEKPPPKKTTIVKPKAKVPPKASSKKNIQPKTKVTKQTQTRINNKKSPKPEPRNATDSQGLVKKTIPKKKTLVSSYSTTTPSPYSLEPSREHFSSSTSVYDPSPVPESGVNVSFTSNNTAATEEPPLWFHESKDTGETTPSMFDVLATPTGITKLDDVTMPSGTLPPGDVHMISSGDVTVTSGALLSGDDITVSYGDVGLVSDIVVLHDGLTMVIPTINSEDMTDLATTPWLDLSEYIPVSVPTTTPEPIINSPPTTIYPSTDKPAITTTTSFTGKAEENRENNSIDLSYNRIAGVDNDISRNNLIPKRRVNLRERTRNKRIQELLEEKRNFLLRMKRGHAAR